MEETATEEPKTETAPPPPADEQQKELPIDLFSDEMPKEEELPLDGEVKEQSYGSIQEPVAGQSTTTTPPSNPSDPNAPPPPNGGPSTAPAAAKTPEEVRSDAEQLVKVLIKGYEKIHGLGRWMGKIDEGELAQKHIANKIDLNQELPLGKKTITVGGFFNEYNTSIDENIVVTDEFKESITPPLVRIAIKRGWSLGDELYVAMIVGEDLATKVSMLIGLKKSANLVLEACYAMMKQKEKKEKEPTQHHQEEAQYEMTNPEEDGWREEDQTNHVPPTQ